MNARVSTRIFHQDQFPGPTGLIDHAGDHGVEHIEGGITDRDNHGEIGVRTRACQHTIEATPAAAIVSIPVPPRIITVDYREWFVIVADDLRRYQEGFGGL